MANGVFRDIKHGICYGVLYLQNIIMFHGARVAVISFMLSGKVPICQTTHQRSTALFADLLCPISLKSGNRPNVANADINAVTFPSKERLAERYVKSTRTTSRNACGQFSTPILCKSEERM